MKSILFLFLTFFIYTIQGQGQLSQSYFGEYVLVRGNQVIINLVLGSKQFRIDFDEIDKSRNKQYRDGHSDIVLRDFDEEGTILRRRDTMILSDRYDEGIMILKIIDKIRLKIIYSSTIRNESDTMFRVSGCDSSGNCWFYTVSLDYGGDPIIYFPDLIGKLSYPINPMLTFVDKKNKIIHQYRDTLLIHPLSRKLCKEMNCFK